MVPRHLRRRRAAGRGGSGEDVYDRLLGEMPAGPSQVLVLPHLRRPARREFIADSAGVMAGLKLETTRGEILKGILEASSST